MAEPSTLTRDPRIDQARGIACLVMVQGHAFDAWVSPEHKAGSAYLLTRVFATLPLPAFLVLAGAAVAYRTRAAQHRGESAWQLRGALLRRGLTVTGAGYLVNAGYVLLDGWESWSVLLRADVLHVIGLSIAALGLCTGGTTGPPRCSRVGTRVLALGATWTVLCPLLSRMGSWLSESHGDSAAVRVLAFVGAPFIDVPGITQMPLVPLFAWSAIGWLAGAWLTLHRLHGQRDRPLLLIAGMGLITSWLGAVGTDLSLQVLGGTLSRRHGAIAFNVIEYAGRGLLVLGVAPLLAARLPGRARNVVVHFGRASLWAYVFHIPLCYGRLAAPFKARMEVETATPYVIALMVVSYAVVVLRLQGPSAVQQIIRRTTLARRTSETP